ncbi:hypothetical protein ACFVWF_33120 [Rhodococcus qingshengii]|uniref:hypothetical protein n=1 Tax=Rhodococcus qingshengii TaxID=334542 RepID=UPI0036DCF20D
MPITLVPINAQRFPSWQDRCHAEYKADLITAGETPHAADRHATDSLERAFPTGAPTADNAVFDLVTTRMAPSGTSGSVATARAMTPPGGSGTS